MKVRKNISIDYDLWKQTKVYAAKNDLTISEVIERALKRYFEEVE